MMGGPKRMMNSKRVRKLASCFMLVIMIWAVTGQVLAYEPPGWLVTQITDNTTNELNPRVSANNVIWSSVGAVYFWDGLVDTYVDMGELPHISGSSVTWYYRYLGNLEIFSWDGVTTTVVTTNLYEDKWPFMSGNNIVWTAKPDGTGTDREIIFYDGLTTTRVTDNANDDGYSPTGGIPSMDISGDNIVWEGSDGTDQEIFFWDSTTNDPGTTVQITTNTSEDMLPQISGSNVVWQGHDGNDYEIFFWDGATTTQITNNTFDDRTPKISGSNVTWSGYDGNDTEIFFWDGATTTQITNNSYSDDEPQISGTDITWSGYDGNGNDREIYLWDGTRTIQFTDNIYTDRSPHISDSLLAWQGYDGDDYEIFIATRSSGDFTGDGITNLIDFGIFGSYWNDSTCAEPDWCQGSDINRNGTMDDGDLLIFHRDWLTQIPTYNLLANWTMDDNAPSTNVLDIGGNANHGTAQQNTSVLSTSGRIGSALSFDGSSDYINLGSPDILDDLPSGDFTVSMWIYDQSDGSNGTIIGSYPVSGTGWLLRKHGIGSEGRISFLSRHSTARAIAYTSVGAISANSWTHVATVWDASTKTVKIYINGTESSYSVFEVGSGSYVSDADYDKKIGMLDNGGGTQFFKGKIDELKIYDRAFTSQEISDIFTATPSGDESIIVGHWPLDDNTADTVVLDFSGNEYHGTASSNTSTLNAIGQVGDCFDLGGSDYVTVTDHDDFSFGDGTFDSPFSIAAWAYKTGSIKQTIVSKWDDLIREYQLQINSESKVRFDLYDQSEVAGIRFIATDALIDGWHHIVAMYDGLGSGAGITVYVDGQPVSGTASAYGVGTYAAMENLDANVVIGADDVSGSVFLDKLDEAMIFNKALTAQEVLSLYTL